MLAGPSSLRVVRKPPGRVRQAVRDNNVALLSRLQHKVDLRNTDRARLTSLAWAALEGSLEVFEWLLLDYGHDDQELSRDADSNTIFHLLASAASHPNPLVRPSPDFPPRPATRSVTETTELVLRMTELYHTLFPFLVDWSNAGGKTAVHVAAQAGNYAFISLLSELGADPGLSDLQGNTPLHYAAAWGHVECARVLVDAGAPATERNADGFTPADYAFTAPVRTALEGLAREADKRARESRDKRRREDGERRTRRESVSTSASVGSGMSYTGSGRYEGPLPPLPGESRTGGAGGGGRSHGAWPADSQAPPTARPGMPTKSPSVPAAPGFALAPLAIPMRRINSAHTAHTASSGPREGSVRSAHSSVKL
ncbi:Target of rapamycin complex 2 subunit avo2 [Cryptotrichosporon argae]